MNKIIQNILFDLRKELLDCGHTCTFPMVSTKSKTWTMVLNKNLTIKAYTDLKDLCVVSRSITSGEQIGSVTYGLNSVDDMWKSAPDSMARELAINLLLGFDRAL